MDLTKEARRAVHAARTSLGPYEPKQKVITGAAKNLERWSNGELDTQEANRYVERAYESIENTVAA